MTSPKHGPLEEYLQRGITANDARQLLEAHDCLTFPHFRSGMFPAANLDDIDNDSTGMTNAWLRDSAYVGLVLLYDGQRDSAARTTQAIIDCLYKIQVYFERIIGEGQAPADDGLRPPVSFSGQDSEPRTDWLNAQNDSLGYALLMIGSAVKAGVIKLTDKDSQLIELLPSYLKAIAYWEDQDLGHWEDYKGCSASSIGTVVAGLEAWRAISKNTEAISFLIDQGLESLSSILPNESLVPVKREYDGALIFLVEPMKLITGDVANQIISNVETHLVGDYGIRRYLGDSYWAPDYRLHQEQDDVKDLAVRENLIKPGGEAQWTIFDPMIAAYYAHRFQASRDQLSKNRANDYLVRSLRQVVTHMKEGANQEVWRIPESFFLEDGEWVPNDNLGLLWSQANLIYSLDVYAEVFKDTPIKAS